PSWPGFVRAGPGHKGRVYIAAVLQRDVHHREAADFLEAVLTVELRGAVAGPEEPCAVEALGAHGDERAGQEHGADAAAAVVGVHAERAEPLHGGLRVTDDLPVVRRDVQRRGRFPAAHDRAEHAPDIRDPVREVLLHEREERQDVIAGARPDLDAFRTELPGQRRDVVPHTVVRQRRLHAQGTILLDRAERGEEGEGIRVGRDVDARDQVAGDVRANVDRGDAVLAPAVHETGQHLRPDALPAVFRAYAEADDPGVVGVAALVGEAEHDADDGAARRLFGDEALIWREVGIQQVRAAPAGGVEWIRPHHLVPGVEKAGLVAGAV